jgi:benzoyl-CoA reductase subunit A
MKVVVGIDLGSTTTKAVLLDAERRVVGKGITNSRSNYEVACAVAREEALIEARFTLLERALGLATGSALPPPAFASLTASRAPVAEADRDLDGVEAELRAAFRLENHLDQLDELGDEIGRLLRGLLYFAERDRLGPAVAEVMARMRAEAPAIFVTGAARKSDFFRDLAASGYMAAAEPVALAARVSFDRLSGLFDRAILDVETRLRTRDFGRLLRRAAARVLDERTAPPRRAAVLAAVEQAAEAPIDEVSFVGTGYGRQTLPFPKAAVRSEILCHGRGAHRIFAGTRTVLDIGGQDTKAIQVDEHGVVTSFQMNDRCAAGCGRYLGYIADELNLGLHELGPLALGAQRVARVNSTCTVFAGAELRERLGLGERREDILAGLHRSIMLRAMSLLARSGGIRDQFTFTGGVCRNPMATKVLAELVRDNYGEGIALNTHPDSIFMGALGAALFGVDDLEAGRPAILPTFVENAGALASNQSGGSLEGPCPDSTEARAST